MHKIEKMAQRNVFRILFSTRMRNKLTVYSLIRKYVNLKILIPLKNPMISLVVGL